jgi:hypothetical protein
LNRYIVAGSLKSGLSFLNWKHRLMEIFCRNKIILANLTIPLGIKIIFTNLINNVFLFDELLKGSKSLKIFKIYLTFRFDKL